jgi:hypothetical protein
VSGPLFDPLESEFAGKVGSAADPRAIETPFGDRGVPSATMAPGKEKAFYTAIRADQGESAAYKEAIYRRGEIGLTRPVKANVRGPDFVSVARDGNGDMWILANDSKIRSVKSSRLPARQSVLPKKWRADVAKAIQDLSLPTQPGLEREIREAFAAGRVRRRDIHVDLSRAESGQLPIFGWDEFKPAHFNLVPAKPTPESSWNRLLAGGKQGASERLGASSPRSVVREAAKGLRKARPRKFDLAKIRISASRCLRVAASAVKGIGKGLIVGALVNIVVDAAWAQLMEWVFSGTDEKTLKSLEQKRAKKVQRLVERAIAKHVWSLARIAGTTYKVVLDFRLLYERTPLNNFLLADMLVDNAYVTEHGRDQIRQGSVARDLKDHWASRLSDADEFVKVFKVQRALDFEYPETGKPSIAGEWTEFYYGKGSDLGKEFRWATFSVGEPADESKAGPVSIQGIQFGRNEPLTIRDAQWTGSQLRVATESGGTLVRYSLIFKDWDTLDAWLDVSTQYDINPDGTRRFETRRGVWRRQKSLLDWAAEWLGGE